MELEKLEAEIGRTTLQLEILSNKLNELKKQWVSIKQAEAPKPEPKTE